MRPRSAPWATPFALATVSLCAAILTPVGRSAASDAVTSLAAPPLVEALRERVDRLRYEQASDARGARVVLPELVARFYEARRFEPAWQGQGRLDQLITGLDSVIDDGLDPSDYHAETLRSYRLDLRMGTTMTAAERADLELIATDAMMLAAYHLYLGKVDPHRLSPQWNFSERPVEIERGLARLSERLAAGEVRELFDAVRPQHAWYQRGRARLREYRRLEADGGWPRVEDGPTLRPGTTDTRVTTLRRRLLVTHDLTDAAVPVQPATYDPTLEPAVRRFQERHGLRADGVIGPATLRALNVPVRERIGQIRVNLERARWTLHELQGDFVLVDVAGFHVSYFRDGEPVWTSRVVVGRDERETPVFRSQITYVVFNPTWTIPPGILVKDKLPELRRDPGALQRMRIRVLDAGGREVDPYTIDWSRYGPGRLPPYQFRQDSGPDNALGLVKIMFPNPYLVYLHDSPAKSLYERDERTFSSGCIRVQRPFELAELLLNDPRWTQPAMQQLVETGRTLTVTLANPIPVLILYWTAQPRADGQVIFRNDVYRRDAATLAALDGDFRVPATTATVDAG